MSPSDRPCRQAHIMRIETVDDILCPAAEPGEETRPVVCGIWNSTSYGVSHNLVYNGAYNMATTTPHPYPT
jgi:hypothetical protein